ncbi:hypothetical protein CAEBREN_08905 [Caenorhabditis brenneri]|uniref:Uncharacterized protein n=1 Tax=Caenorhabditis brenneri TaxID=135651 RepID=G0NDB9_CAEBE|nr:hypothetical protein CAEBREN_08905 [Caenorhabditis brenneri]
MSEDKKAASSSVKASVGFDSPLNCLQFHDEDNVHTNKSKAPIDPRNVSGDEDREDEEAFGKSVYFRKDKARTLRHNEHEKKHEKNTAEKKKQCTGVMEENEEESFKQLMEKMKIGAPAREELAEAMKLKEPAGCKLNCKHPCCDK